MAHRLPHLSRHRIDGIRTRAGVAALRVVDHQQPDHHNRIGVDSPWGGSIGVVAGRGLHQ